ncbi:tRNA pseudouridine(13) synthase TruD [Helicobacter sp. 23-1045]
MLNYLSHAPINFHFAKSPKSFIVEEIPLYGFCGSGEHLILKVRKKNLSTAEMLNIFSENLGIKRAEIGYAGLKDKNALSIQYISLPKKFEAKAQNLSNENIKILDSATHKNKLKLGHLAGNKFHIQIKKVDKINALKIDEVCKIIAQNGMPNYFGAQRFGKNGDNFLEGKALMEGKIKVRDKKIAKFLISAYQSHLFNLWLENRIRFCQILRFAPNEAKNRYKITQSDLKDLQNQAHFFKILRGDVACEFPQGKLFYTNAESAPLFSAQKLAPTGILYGGKILKAKDFALEFEMPFYDEILRNEIGDRRVAWVFPQNLNFIYKKEVAQGEFNFSLPKGSYGTIFLEILQNTKDFASKNAESSADSAIKRG